MRILAKALLLIALVIGGAVAWYTIKYPTYVYRYRMTVEVAVSGKVHSGASVIEVRIATQPHGGDVPPYVPHVRGEAVFVDLGEGRNVIALLAAGPVAENVNYPDQIVPALFDVPFENWAALSGMRGTKEVPISKLPTFVTFSNLDDPKTAHIVSLYDLEKEFGPDVQFKRVSIEITEDPVTRNLDKKLSWLPHPKYLSGNFACGPSAPHCLHGGHFYR
ncbi:MAG TPA: hypothetical protein VNR39_00255 [Pseudolabrys sp.]|nr:hypothetical protein [Pseudolabrys sp.]